jgi:hypothetical protein
MDNDLLLPNGAVAVSNCKLPEYWPDAPALWFSRAECSFLLRNVSEQREKFCLVVQALPRDSMRLVADLVETPPAELMYNALKERLLHSHQLTDIQKVDFLVNMPALGDRKPTQLLAAIVEACPRGQENSVFMLALFLRKLPARTWRPPQTSWWPCGQPRRRSLQWRRTPGRWRRWPPAVEVLVRGRTGDGGETEEEEAAGRTGAVQGGQAGRRAVPQALAVWSPGLQL